MINLAPGFRSIFGPLGPTAGPGSPGNGPGSKHIAVCPNNQPPETKFKARPGALCVFGTDRKKINR